MNAGKFLSRFALLFLTLAVLPTSVSAGGGGGWTQVRSKNFNLVGNADEKDIRAVAVKLEQFREGLSRILPRYKFNSPIPTTVVVFKSALDYKPYKPLKTGGETNDNVTGFFQGGKDVNYITLSTEAENARTFQIIFHEYTHFLFRNNLGESKIPSWYNEGTAAYYETFAVENDRTVTLGAAPPNFVALLRRSELIPFEKFLSFDNASLHEQGKEGVGLFYAQAWALTHYLKHGNGGARAAQLDKFLDTVIAGKSPRAAFFEAFQADYATVEAELKSYIEQNNFSVAKIELEERLKFNAELTAAPLANAEVKAYLGDLLLHSGRLSEAEAHLEDALRENPNSGTALAAYGLLKARQEDFAKALEYLEKAVETDPSNYFVHFAYAYVLSREGMSGFGFIVRYDPFVAEKMRRALKKAIALNPDFAESYDLYAFISIVRNEEIDEAIRYQNKALELAPGNQWYLIHLSELYLRKEDFAKAKALAAKVTHTAGEKELKVYAQNALGRILSTEAAYEEIKNYKDRPRDDSLYQPLTDEELAKLRAQRLLESLNESLYKTQPGERRVLGYLTRIDCQPREMIYSVRVNDKVIKLRSASFDSVRFVAFSGGIVETQVGCGGMKKEIYAVVNYRPSAGGGRADAAAEGEIVSIEFVPANFTFLD